MASKSDDPNLPFSDSVGYQLRVTHRALQRYLQAMIQPHGITIGMWYFLRALWDEDGQTHPALWALWHGTRPLPCAFFTGREQFEYRSQLSGRQSSPLLTLFCGPE